jgi:hypothetical protein
MGLPGVMTPIGVQRRRGLPVVAYCEGAFMWRGRTVGGNWGLPPVSLRC